RGRRQRDAHRTSMPRVLDESSRRTDLGRNTDARVDDADAVQRQRYAPSVGPGVRAAVHSAVRARVTPAIGGDALSPAVDRIDRRRSIRIRPRASAERGEREGSSGTPRHGYFGGSRSAERNARITSSRLFSLISSSAKSVGRSSASISTGLSLKKLGGAEFFAAAGGTGRGAGFAAGLAAAFAGAQ